MLVFVDVRRSRFVVVFPSSTVKGGRQRKERRPSRTDPPDGGVSSACRRPRLAHRWNSVAAAAFHRLRKAVSDPCTLKDPAVLLNFPTKNRICLVVKWLVLFTGVDINVATRRHGDSNPPDFPKPVKKIRVRINKHSHG